MKNCILNSDFPYSLSLLLSPLTLHYKLFGSSHVPDIVGTSGTIPAAGLMTRQEIVTALKDTCVMLDERKAEFELMTHSLEKEDVEVEDEQEDNEDNNVDEAGNDDKESEEASGSSSDAE